MLELISTSDLTKRVCLIQRPSRFPQAESGQRTQVTWRKDGTGMEEEIQSYITPTHVKVYHDFNCSFACQNMYQIVENNNSRGE